MMRKCINNQSNPVVEGQIGKPPFEKPSIAKVGESKVELGGVGGGLFVSGSVAH